jgi:hypothetical protein
LQKINADEDTRLIRAAETIVAPVLEAKSTGSESILSGSAEASTGLAVAPATPALALAQ